MDAIVTLELVNPLCFLKFEHNRIDERRLSSSLSDVYLQLKTTLHSRHASSLPELRRLHLLFGCTHQRGGLVVSLRGLQDAALGDPGSNPGSR